MCLAASSKQRPTGTPPPTATRQTTGLRSSVTTEPGGNSRAPLYGACYGAATRLEQYALGSAGRLVARGSRRQPCLGGRHNDQRRAWATPRCGADDWWSLEKWSRQFRTVNSSRFLGRSTRLV